MNYKINDIVEIAIFDTKTNGTLLTGNLILKKGDTKNMINKQPLGVKPKKFYEWMRVQELTRALYEYSKQTFGIEDINVMHIWAEELVERLRELKHIIEDENVN